MNDMEMRILGRAIAKALIFGFLFWKLAKANGLGAVRWTAGAVLFGPLLAGLAMWFVVWRAKRRGEAA